MSRKRHRTEIGAAADEEAISSPKIETESASGNILYEEIRRVHDELRLYKFQLGHRTRDDSKLHETSDPIPALINRIFAEFSCGVGAMMTPVVKDMMISVVIDFVEPHLARDIISSDTEKVTERSEDQFDELYRKRAVAWAANITRRLLYPGKQTDIPELDALLASAGSNYGLDRDRSVQKALFEAVRCAKSTCPHSRADLVNDEFSRDPGGDDSTKMTETKADAEESLIWVQSPEAWLLELRNGRSTSKLKRDNAMNQFPFLAQMEDFHKRHRK